MFMPEICFVDYTMFQVMIKNDVSENMDLIFFCIPFVHAFQKPLLIKHPDGRLPGAT